VDADRHTLTLYLNRFFLTVPDVPMAEDAKMMVRGRPAHLADLKPGMHVIVQMSADPEKSLAVGVQAK
jgi:hypothetical protein